MTPVITEIQRNELRKRAASCLSQGLSVSVNAAHLLDLLDCADRCAELEDVLRAVDAALENEFGGFYLSAPDGDSMYDIREMLKGER